MAVPASVFSISLTAPFGKGVIDVVIIIKFLYSLDIVLCRIMLREAQFHFFNRHFALCQFQGTTDTVDDRVVI